MIFYFCLKRGTVTTRFDCITLVYMCYKDKIKDNAASVDYMSDPIIHVRVG